MHQRLDEEQMTSLPPVYFTSADIEVLNGSIEESFIRYGG